MLPGTLPAFGGYYADAITWTTDQVCKWLEGADETRDMSLVFRQHKVLGRHLFRIDLDALYKMAPRATFGDCCRAMDAIDAILNRRETIKLSNPLPK